MNDQETRSMVLSGELIALQKLTNIKDVLVCTVIVFGFDLRNGIQGAKINVSSYVGSLFCLVVFLARGQQSSKASPASKLPNHLEK